MALTADECFRRIRANDKAFLEELRLIVRRIAARWKSLNINDIEDIVQDCLLVLMTNLERGDFKGEASFSTYLYAIVRNTCSDYYRAARLRDHVDVEEITLADTAPTQEESLEHRQRRDVACRVLLSLPRKCRRLWRVIFFGGRTYREAAELLGLTEGAVKRKMWECRQRARELAETYKK